MSSEPLTLAFIGCGGIARRHVVAMQDLIDRGRAGFVVTAVCDANQESAQAMARTWKNALAGVLPSTATINNCSPQRPSTAPTSVFPTVFTTPSPSTAWRQACMCCARSHWA